MANKQKPGIFIGSSVEGLPIAYEIQTALEHEADCTVWPQGVFEPGSVTLHDLIGMTRQVWRSLLAQRARKVHGQIPSLMGVVYHNGPSVLDPEEGIVVIATKETGFKKPRYIV